MAVLRQFNALGQARLDVPHLRSIESSIAADFDVIAGRVQAGGKALVIRGFTLTNFAAGTNATSIQLSTADGIVYNMNASEAGTFLWVPASQPIEVLNSATNGRIFGGFTANQVNYVGLDFIRTADNTTSDLVQFLDSNTLIEQAKNVPLARTLDYRIVISTMPFSTASNIIPIAKVKTDAQNRVDTAVNAVEDARSIMWRLGSGGDFPNQYGSFTWPQNRVEFDVNIGSFSTLDKFTGGDKGLKSEKDWMDAVMTRLWEVGGGQHWYSPTTGVSNVKMTKTPGSVFSSTGENFEWVSGLYTVNHIHWQGLKIVFENTNITGIYYNTISDQLTDDPGTSPPSATTSKTALAIGDCIYVDIDRTSNATVTAKKAALQTLGSPTVPGSRIVLAWRDASGSVFTRDNSFPVNTSFTPATPTSLGSVRLSRNYTGTLASPAGSNGSPVIISDRGGIIVSVATSNLTGLVSTGDGTGHGLQGTSGATGGAAGVRGIGTTTNRGGYFTSTSGRSIEGSGSSDTGGYFSGDTYGVNGLATAGNGIGINGTGFGTGTGVMGTGGSGGGNGVTGQGAAGAVGGNFIGGASGAGVEGTGGTGNTIGVLGFGTGTGSGTKGVGAAGGIGVEGTGGAGAVGILGNGGSSAAGGSFIGGTGNTLGVVGQGVGSGRGGSFTGGATGDGLVGQGGATGNGVVGNGGATSGVGGFFTGGPNSTGAVVNGGTGNTNGIVVSASGTGNGINSDSGASVGSNAVRGFGNNSGTRGGYFTSNDFRAVEGSGTSDTGGYFSGGTYGVYAFATAGAGIGVNGIGQGGGAGGNFTGGATGNGVVGQGGTSSVGGAFTGGSGGAGVLGTGGIGNTLGVLGQGHGTGAGGSFIGGGTGSAAGIVAQGGAAGGNGAQITGGAASIGLIVQGGAGQTAAQFTGGAGNSDGLQGFGIGTGVGIHAVPGTGDAIKSDGTIFMAGSTPSSSTAFTNQITPKNVCKAWVKLSLNNSGSPAILEGFNIASIAVGANILTITWAGTFSGTQYSVLLTLGDELTTTLTHARIITQGTTFTNIRLRDNSGAQLDPAGVGVNTLTIHVQVFAAQ